MADESFGKAIKPKSDVYSIMLLFSFLLFVTSFVFVWVWLDKDYDSGFPALHGNTKQMEREHRQKTVNHEWARHQGKNYLLFEEWPEAEDYNPETGLPEFDDYLKTEYVMPRREAVTDVELREDPLKKYEAEVADELLRSIAPAKAEPETEESSQKEQE